MFTIRDVLIEQERCQDKLRRVEYGRLVRQVTPTNNFKCLLCIRLGNMLVRFGRQLQTRYVIQPSKWVHNSEIWLQSR